MRSRLRPRLGGVAALALALALALSLTSALTRPAPATGQGAIDVYEGSASLHVCALLLDFTETQRVQCWG